MPPRLASGASSSTKCSACRRCSTRCSRWSTATPAASASCCPDRARANCAGAMPTCCQGACSSSISTPYWPASWADDFHLDRVLAHGTLPGIYAESDQDLRARDLRSYADTYLREEVQAEALVRDIGGYSRLLDLVAASSGRVINLHAMSGDAGVGYETARRYLDVLEDTLVLHRIPAWAGSDRAAWSPTRSSCSSISACATRCCGGRWTVRWTTSGACCSNTSSDSNSRDVAEAPGLKRGSFISARGAGPRWTTWCRQGLRRGPRGQGVTVGGRRRHERPGGVRRASRAPGAQPDCVPGARRQRLDGADAIPLREFLDELPGL